MLIPGTGWTPSAALWSGERTGCTLLVGGGAVGCSEAWVVVDAGREVGVLCWVVALSVIRLLV